MHVLFVFVTINDESKRRPHLLLLYRILLSFHYCFLVEIDYRLPNTNNITTTTNYSTSSEQGDSDVPFHAQLDAVALLWEVSVQRRHNRRIPGTIRPLNLKRIVGLEGGGKVASSIGHTEILGRNGRRHTALWELAGHHDAHILGFGGNCRCDFGFAKDLRQGKFLLPDVAIQGRVLDEIPDHGIRNFVDKVVLGVHHYFSRHPKGFVNARGAQQGVKADGFRF